MSALGDVLDALTRVFLRLGVDWYVFGAQAVSARAAPRATQDVDVTARIPRHQLQDALTALTGAGFAHRYPDIADELLLAGAVLPLSHVATGFDVDLVIAGSGLEELALARVDRLSISGVTVPVAHPTDLVVMKVLAGRGKDLDDVRALLATGKVDVDEARDLLGQLETSLGQSDLVPRLDEALRPR